MKRSISLFFLSTLIFFSSLVYADGAVPYCSPSTVACQNLSARMDETLTIYARVNRILTYMVAIKGAANDYTKIASAFGTPLASDQGAASGLALFNAVNTLNGYLTNARDSAAPMDRFGQ